MKKANLVSETDFYNKLISFNKKVSSNKTKYLEVQKKKLNRVTTKDCNFLLGRVYITINDGSQNTLVYQQTLELKKIKVLIIFLLVYQMEPIIFNLSHYIRPSYIAKNFLDTE